MAQKRLSVFYSVSFHSVPQFWITFPYWTQVNTSLEPIMHIQLISHHLPDSALGTHSYTQYWWGPGLVKHKVRRLMQSWKPRSKVLKHFSLVVFFFLTTQGHDENSILSEFIWASFIQQIYWETSMYYIYMLIAITNMSLNKVNYISSSWR